MPNHLIVVDECEDFRWVDPSGLVITAEEYLRRGRGAPELPVVNLCREHGHLSSGYYVSLIAEARGAKALPDMRAVADLDHAEIRDECKAALESLLARAPRLPGSSAAFSLHVYFGEPDQPVFKELAHRAFELLRTPILRIDFEQATSINFGQATPWRIASLRVLAPQEVPQAHDAILLDGLERLALRMNFRSEGISRPVDGSADDLAHPFGQAPRRAPPSRLDLAVLVNPRDKIPPSKAKALARLADVGRELRVTVTLVEPRDYERLASFDALFIRETTSVSDHTYLFARKAEQEGIPVLDDPASIIRCTNKVFLAELMRRGGVATPATRFLTRHSLADIEKERVFPVVVKIPHGSFSKGVERAADQAQLREIAEAMLTRSHVVIVQDFLHTEFDWRIGVLGGEPFFAARYFMCDRHWQILKHAPDGSYVEGVTEAVATGNVPHKVLDAALRAAHLVGDGLYGVDLKETSEGVFVMEVNDNPNIDVGLEDAVLGDELYRRLLLDFQRRIEATRRRGSAKVIRFGRTSLADIEGRCETSATEFALRQTTRRERPFK
ncbi:Glutathione synthase/RimK-type ligase, ATP-grasp superfamily [Rhizobiales bacterium GAS191]|nr:Glutathione synthase/RimK-type ligase, ATP-grasp superfamily [Rhizobiales bacterium GAS113]SEE20049.1 Glutathione synthase/RimK-type ligase, ATP-grasp superfamily [Rhizobiales bacterium GAS191]